MASQKFLPCINWEEKIHIVLQCEARRLFDTLDRFKVRQETEPESKKGSRKTQEGDYNKMHNYSFKFKGGSTRIEKANFKFFVFVVDTQAKEHHLHGARRTGLVNPAGHGIYDSSVPVVKVFTSTSGFGIAKEYFSYFIMLSPSTSKTINILPLGFKTVTEWSFSGQGRFMGKEEIKRFFGHDSDTYRFYCRQALLSKRRLMEMVTITDAQSFEAVDEKIDEVRLLRFD